MGVDASDNFLRTGAKGWCGPGDRLVGVSAVPEVQGLLERSGPHPPTCTTLCWFTSIVIEVNQCTAVQLVSDYRYSNIWYEYNVYSTRVLVPGIRIPGTSTSTDMIPVRKLLYQFDMIICDRSKSVFNKSNQIKSNQIIDTSIWDTAVFERQACIWKTCIRISIQY